MANTGKNLHTGKEFLFFKKTGKTYKLHEDVFPTRAMANKYKRDNNLYGAIIIARSNLKAYVDTLRRHIKRERRRNGISTRELAPFKNALK